MEFVINRNGIGQEQNEAQEQFINTLSDIESAVALLKAQVAAITSKDNSQDNAINNLSTATASISASLTDLDTVVSSLSNSVVALNNKNTATLNTASIQTATINELNVTGNTSFSKPITAEINNSKVSTTNLSAADGNITSINNTNMQSKNATIENLSVTQSLNIDNLEVDEIVNKNTTSDNITVNDNLIFNGINIKSININATGLTNDKLHKLTIKTDGLLVIKLNNSSIVITPSSVSSNFSNLYAAYIVNGVHNIYLSSDINCQALVIGSANITTSTVLKTSVRRNVDSNGQPNVENTVKVAVVDKLPTIGQRNVIYVVLGDCAYYCDGQYFYEMAAKKQG